MIEGISQPDLHVGQTGSGAILGDVSHCGVSTRTVSIGTYLVQTWPTIEVTTLSDYWILGSVETDVAFELSSALLLDPYKVVS